MRVCNDCGAAMAPMLTSFVCSAECDLRNRPTVDSDDGDWVYFWHSKGPILNTGKIVYHSGFVEMHPSKSLKVQVRWRVNRSDVHQSNRADRVRIRNGATVSRVPGDVDEDWR